MIHSLFIFDMRKLLSVVIATLLAGIQIYARITLPSVLSDNMVLQRNSCVALWGTASTGAKVTIRPSWKGARSVTVVADARTGKWMANVKTPCEGGPYEIVISDGNTVRLKNILIGEVWLCSGQSNMYMPMTGYSTQPVQGAAQVIARARPERQIRICKIKNKASKTRLSTSEGTWMENTPEAVSGCSAAAYFFAESLQSALGVPVGIICSSCGDTRIEAWIPSEDICEKFPDIPLGHLDPDGVVSNDKYVSSMRFNGQLSPVIPYTFKGMIWYQGETNRIRCSSDERYPALTKVFVDAMRREFHNPDMPFYFCQICPYAYSKPLAFRNGYFWEAQAKIPAIIENCHMISTCDLGSFATNHPPRKREIGERFALSALQHTYGCEWIKMDPPVFKSYEIKGSCVICDFDVDDRGLSPRNCNLEGFEIAGEDRIFHKAIGFISVKDKFRKQVSVSSDEVPTPVAVRYCFRNWCVGSVFNNFGVPASPFRTDNWDDIEQ